MTIKLFDRFNTAVHREQIRGLYQQSPFLFFGIIFVMVVVAMFFWEKVDQLVMLSWLTVNMTLTIARVLLVKSFHRVNPGGEALLKWGVVFAISSTLSGMIWGSISVLFLDPDEIESVLLCAIVLTGMVSGSLVPLSTFIPAYYGFTLFALSPLTVVMLGSADSVLVLIGYLVVAFIAVSLGYSFVVNRNLAESIRLRYENLELLEDVNRQKDIAEKANTDKSRFLAATSHDLRQPLHAMDLYLGALKNILNKQEQIDLLRKSQQSSAALNNLLTALMDVSRLDAGDVIIDRKNIDVHSVLKSISDEYHEQTGQLGIELRVEAEKIVVNTDETMLGRILRNLVNNACSHSGANLVILSAELAGDQVIVAVCDDGCGIAEHEQQQVFSEFYQLKNPERDRSKGLGLGLAIVKRLTDLLQHDLRLDSRTGEGSCFRVIIPVVDVVVDTEVKDNPATSDISGSFIILVDDEVEVREAMSALLKQWDCELLVVDSITSLQLELASLDYPAPDLILADYRLRDNTTGVEFVVTVRKYFDADIPALVISGDTDRSVESDVRKASCVLLHKPVKPEVLREAIYSLISL